MRTPLFDAAMAPRSRAATLATLTPPGCGVTLTALLDAVSARPLLLDPDRPNQLGLGDRHGVLRHGDRLTFPIVKARIDAALGPDATDHLKHLASYFAPGYDLRVETLTPAGTKWAEDAALVIGSGWTQDHGWGWYTHTQCDFSLSLVADWVATWDLASLDACLHAGLSATELTTLLTTQTLPDPAQIGFLLDVNPRELHPTLRD